MKAIARYAIIATGVAILHFGTVFVTVLFLWLGEWGSGPQGGEVSITLEERQHREQIKPYGNAFMAFLRLTDKALAFPMSLNGARELRRPRTAVLNSAIWGVGLAGVVVSIHKRRTRKAQPSPSPYGGSSLFCVGRRPGTLSPDPWDFSHCCHPAGRVRQAPRRGWGPAAAACGISP